MLNPSPPPALTEPAASAYDPKAALEAWHQKIEATSDSMRLGRQAKDSSWGEPPERGSRLPAASDYVTWSQVKHEKRLSRMGSDEEGDSEDGLDPFALRALDPSHYIVDRSVKRISTT